VDRKHEKDHLDAIVGNNIQHMRTERRISRDELSSMLGISVSHLGLIERGGRGATAVNLSKLATIFDMPINNLFIHSVRENTTVAEGPDPGTQASMMKINSIVSSLSDRDLEVVMCLVAKLAKMSNN